MISHSPVSASVLGVARGTFAITLVFFTACAPGETNEKRVPVAGRTSVLIGPTEICTPPGVWVLIRKENHACAVQVGEIWSAAGGTHAEIDVGLPVAGGWKRHTMAVAEYPLVGPHPLAFQRGNVQIPCGSFKIQYSRPSCISLYTSGGDETRDRVLAAPTAWTSLDDVDMSDQRLTWYTVDDDRAEEVELARLLGQVHVK